MTTVEHVRVGGHQVGLPEGVFLAPLGRRLAAFAIDALIPYALIIAGLLVGRNDDLTRVAMILRIVAVLWLILLLVMVALRAAGPGMRLLHLQVVGLQDGRPIGVGRSLLRGLILGVLLATGVGVIIEATVMVLQARRQGWHDQAVDSVVITERQLAPPRPRSTARADRAGSVAEAVPTRDRVDLVEEGADPGFDQAGSDQAGSDLAGADPARPDPDQYWAERQEQERQRREHEQRLAQRAAQDQAEDDQEADGAGRQPESAEPDSGSPAAVADAVDVAGPAETPTVDQGWVIILEDGREVAIQRLVLVGRNPQPQHGEEDARLIKIMDEARTVSKTHLSLSVDADGLAVTDRRSTNGSAITAPDGTYELLTPDQPRRLPEAGYLISFGKHQFRIGRHV